VHEALPCVARGHLDVFALLVLDDTAVLRCPVHERRKELEPFTALRVVVEDRRSVAGGALREEHLADLKRLERSSSASSVPAPHAAVPPTATAAMGKPSVTRTAVVHLRELAQRGRCIDTLNPLEPRVPADQLPTRGSSELGLLGEIRDADADAPPCPPNTAFAMTRTPLPHSPSRIKYCRDLGVLRSELRIVLGVLPRGSG